MNRAEFLKAADVRKFLDWLTSDAGRLNSPNGVGEFFWISRSKRWTGVERGERWSAESLPAARCQYYWPSINPVTGAVHTSFDENAEVLDNLRCGLLNALNTPGAHGLQEACFSVLSWGGVGNRPRVALPVRRGPDEGGELEQYIRKVVALLRQEDLTEASVRGFRTGRPEPFEDSRMDSGTTKIFSLLVDEFVIYDTRVACALGGLLGVWWHRYCEKIGTPLPPALRLRMDRTNHRGAKVRRRFPNLALPGLNDGQQTPNERLWSNVRANWLCQELGRRLTCQGQPMRTRDVEAALFMIGYSADWLDS